MAPWLLLAGAALFSWLRFRLQKDWSGGMLLVAVLCGYLLVNSNNPIALHLVQDTSRTILSDTNKIGQERSSSSPIAQGYSFSGIRASGEIFFFGHPERPARTQHMATKNYYLELAFNFGVISLIPIVCLLLYTAYLVRSRWSVVVSSIDHALLLLVVLFLVVLDNSMQVGLRQPYSGVFTFFLWGLLLANLNQKQK